jgi:hypothetical protein
LLHLFKLFIKNLECWAFFNLLKTLKSIISESSLDNKEEFMIKGEKKEVTKDEDHTQEINPKQSVPALIPIEK